MSIALRFCQQLRDRPQAVELRPTRRHWSIFVDLLERSGVVGPLTADAYLAALAIEYGTVVGADRLADRVWNDGDLPVDPKRTLRTYLTRLRRALGDTSAIVSGGAR